MPIDLEGTISMLKTLVPGATQRPRGLSRCIIRTTRQLEISTSDGLAARCSLSGSLLAARRPAAGTVYGSLSMATSKLAILIGSFLGTAYDSFNSLATWYVHPE
jgi:hypothetical protein